MNQQSQNWKQDQRELTHAQNEAIQQPNVEPAPIAHRASIDSFRCSMCGSLSSSGIGICSECLRREAD
jgi:hypothetical protein